MIRIISVLFFAAVVIINVDSAFSQTDAAGDKRVRSQVEKLGTGAKVTVTMKDGTRHKGSISQILDDSFDVTLGKATQSSILSYRDVASVKRRGWTNSAKILTGVLVGGGAIVVVVAVLASKSSNIRFF